MNKQTFIDPSSKNGRRWVDQHFSWVAICLVILVGIIAYHNCLPNAMFWDDDDFILKNRFIKDFRFWPLWFQQNLVAGSYLVSNYWRPLLLSVFATEWSLWQNWVYGWHIVSVAWHIADGIILYFLITRLFANRTLGLAVALIFTAHPTHNEAVVYVNSLGDSLATFFVLSSLLLFTHFRQSGKAAWCSRNYLFSFVMFPLAIMSKETGFVLCALLPLTDFLLLQTNKPFWTRVKNTAAIAWPFILLALLYIIARGTILNFSNSFNFYNEQNAFTSNPLIRLMTFFKVMTQNAGFLFFPYELRVERQIEWAKSLFEWDVLFGGTIVLSMLYAGFKYWRSKPLISFGVGWFFIAIAPTSNVLVPINAVIYEHFLYVPMIGITLIVVFLGLSWAANEQRLRLLGKTLIVILIVFCAIHIRRNLDWRTAIHFYDQLAPLVPWDYRVINNWGMEYANKGFNDKAETIYLKAIALDPKNPVAYHNIAGTYRDTNRTDLAITTFKKAIKLNPNFIFSYRSLAEIYWRLTRWPECRDALLQILRMDPTDANVRQALAIVEQQINKN